MESLGKDHPCSDSSVTSSTGPEDYAVPEVIITHRLRDREMLRKRKEAAQQKESDQWVLRHQNKRQRRSRVPRKGRCHQPVEEPIPQTEEKKEAEPVPQENAEPVLHEPAPPPQPPMVPSQDLLSGMQAVGELAPRILNPAGEEEVTPAEAEIPEALNAPLENVEEENEYFPHVLF